MCTFYCPLRKKNSPLLDSHLQRTSIKINKTGAISIFHSINFSGSNDKIGKNI